MKITKKSLVIISILLGVVIALYFGLSYRKLSAIANKTKIILDQTPGVEAGSIDYSLFPTAKVKISKIKITNKFSEILADSVTIKTGNVFSKSVKIYLKDGVSYKVESEAGSMKFKNPENSFIKIDKSGENLSIQYQDEGLIIASDNKKANVNSNNKLSILSSVIDKTKKTNINFNSSVVGPESGPYKILAELSLEEERRAQGGSRKINLKNISISSKSINIGLFGDIKIKPQSAPILKLELSLLKSEKLFDFVFNNANEEILSQKNKIIPAIKELAAKNQKTKEDNLIFKIESSSGGQAKINNISITEIARKF
jgi:hypothetical protein